MSRNAHFVVGASAPVGFLARGAAQFAERHGQGGYPRQFSSVIAHPAMTSRLAQQYGAAPMFDDRAVPHFEAMRNETAKQFDYLTAPLHRGGLGVDVEATEKDPYGGPADMMRDVAENRRLRVLSTASTGGHPFFTNDENDQFRAVHDAFGHAGTGRGFDRHGEEAAYQSHARMFTPVARRALATETRGQNSAYVAGGGGNNFQPQKIALLPDSTRAFTPLVGRRTLAAQDQAARAHREAFPMLHARQFGTL